VTLPRGVVCLAALAAAILGLGLAAARADAAQSTFNYSSGYQSFTVPSGVTSLHLDVVGGSGGSGQGNYGGGAGASGGEIVGDLAVTPGQVFTLWVGGGGQSDGGQGYGNPTHNDFEGGSGASGYGVTTGNGGGGGAASYIKLGSTMIAVGGGGGGGGGGGDATGGSGASGGTGASTGLHYQYSWNGSGNNGNYPANDGPNPGYADNGSENGSDGTSAPGPNFGGGGGGGGGGYYVCANSSQYSGCNVLFSAGGGGNGNNNINGYGGSGGAGGDSFGAESLANVSFSASGFSPSHGGQITLTYGTASGTTVQAQGGQTTSLQGQSVTYIAFVQPTDGGGTVTFSSDGTDISGCKNLTFLAGGGDDWGTSCSAALPAGTHTITATYSGDSGYASSSGSMTETVYAPVSITTSSLADGTVGQSYSHSLAASGGSNSYTWSLTAGTLPDGLSLSSAGTISGTPTHAMSQTFTVEATDTNTGQTDTKQLSINVTGGTSSPLIIQGLRFAGPGGAADDYVELYNPTANAVDLTGWWLGYPGGVVKLSSGSLPSGGHYLIAGSAYSLSSYASADLAPSGLDLPSDGGVQLIAPDSTVTDAVGMTTAGAAYRAGAGLTAPTQNGNQLAFERRMSGGAPVTDTTNNAADFLLVATDANSTDHGAGAVFGAPAPQDLTSRIDRNDIAQSYLFDPAQTASGTNNRSYNAATGTLTVRRKITNTSTTQTITALWLRYTSMTTYGTATSGQAILTAQTSAGGDTVNGKVLTGATLDQPPSQPNGGGIGSSVLIDVGDGGLGPGQSINVELQFHASRGTFAFGYNAEVYTGH
jgi:hypothetical protein